jgi:hypothetical protein
MKPMKAIWNGEKIAESDETQTLAGTTQNPVKRQKVFRDT